MLKSTLTVAAIALAAVAALVYAMNRSQRMNVWEPPPVVGADMAPTWAEAEEKCIGENAIDGAQQIVLENIKAPTTARFSEQRVLYRRGSRVMARLACDAQNSFGALIRERYCVFFEYTNCQSGKMAYRRDVGLMTCQEPPTPELIAAGIRATGWVD